MITILITALNLQVSAGGIAQTVSLSLENEPLSKAFDEIKRQTGYTFIYKDEFVRLARPVTIHVKNESLENVLKIYAPVGVPSLKLTPTFSNPLSA